MKTTLRIVCIALVIAMFASVTMSITACSKTNNGDKPVTTANPNGGNDSNRKMTSTPQKDTESKNEFPENWGIDDDITIITVNYAGIEHTYTSSQLYAFGPHYARLVSGSNIKTSSRYHGISFKNILADIGIDTDNPDIKNITLVDVDGEKWDLNADLPIVSIQSCEIAMAKNDVVVKEDMGTFFILDYVTENAPSKEFINIVAINIE